MSKSNNNSAMSNKVTTVVATAGYGPDVMSEISYTDAKIVGNGSFGVVFQAKLLPSNELVAIKKVLQDRRFKNRELQIMRKLRHVNIITLKYFFYSSGDKRDEVYLNLVMEFVPETLYKVERQYARAKQTLPVNFVRLYMYQLCRSMAYIHSFGYCHRDIKPQNLLIDPETAVLKLCDFGSAKQLVSGEPNVSYICSRYYRAPELIFGSTNYNTKIDMWSAGCVLAELLLGQLIFPGDSGVDQIVEIVKVMGTPTQEQLYEMNPNYKQFKLPQLKPHPWQKVFRIRTPSEAIDLVSKLLVYTPNARISPMMGCAHPFFDELRQEPNQLLPNGRSLPPLFNFNDYERTIEPHLMPLLLPGTHRTRGDQPPTRPIRNSAGEDAAATTAPTMQPSTTAATTTAKEQLANEGDNAHGSGQQRPTSHVTFGHRHELGNGDHDHANDGCADLTDAPTEQLGADDVDDDDADEVSMADQIADDDELVGQFNSDRASSSSSYSYEDNAEEEHDDDDDDDDDGEGEGEGEEEDDGNDNVN